MLDQPLFVSIWNMDMVMIRLAFCHIAHNDGPFLTLLASCHFLPMMHQGCGIHVFSLLRPRQSVWCLRSRKKGVEWNC